MKILLALILLIAVVVTAIFYFNQESTEEAVQLNENWSAGDTDLNESINPDSSQLDSIESAVTEVLDEKLTEDSLSEELDGKLREEIEDVNTIDSGNAETDDIGGYYDENALAPEDETAQNWSQGPIGEENPNPIAPEAGSENMPTGEAAPIQDEPILDQERPEDSL